jgi:hypothetical protein
MSEKRWSWWCTPIISALRRLKNNPKFEANMNYVASSKPTRAKQHTKNCMGTFMATLFKTIIPIIPATQEDRKFRASLGS